MNENIIGRGYEIKRLEKFYNSPKSEFITIYGRRRVGKTYLINQFFKDRFAFDASGIIDGSKEAQFYSFYDSLTKYGYEGEQPKNWFEMFSALSKLLEKQTKNERKVVFIDEIPCFDTPKSDFVKSLGYFWNSFAAKRNDILLIVCGSATSWIVSKIIDSRGGLHNRTTGDIYLQQFTLAETEEYLKHNNFGWPRQLIAETYMVLGGIPYYLSLLDNKETLAANIDRLYFSETGELRREYQRLYKSLFSNADPYMKIIETLGKTKSGLTRTEISDATKLPQNGRLTKMLDDLQHSGMIRCFYGKSRGKVKKRDAYYQLMDLFSIFHLTFGGKPTSPTFWQDRAMTPTLNTWCGLSFERICFVHIEQIRKALGLSRIALEYYSWRSRGAEPKAQIDLIIERADKIINICEIKYATGEYAISRQDDLDMRNRIEAFRAESGTRCGLIPTWITTCGLKEGMYSSEIQYRVTLDDLFWNNKQ